MAKTSFNLPQLWDMRFRGRLRYGLTGGFDAQSLSLTGEIPLPGHFHLTTELNQSWQKQQPSRLGLRLTREFEGYNLDFAAQYQQGGHYNLSLNLSFNLDGFSFRDPDQREAGRVHARVFLDNNGSGRFDEGDTPMPEVHFTVDGRAADEVTDAIGEVRLPVDVNRRVVVKVSPGVFGDHYWDVDDPKRAVITRQGKALVLEYAARLNGEIEGTVYKSGGEPSAVRRGD